MVQDQKFFIYEKENIINNGSFKKIIIKVLGKNINKIHSKRNENNKLTDIIMSNDNEEQLKKDIKLKKILMIIIKRIIQI